MKNILFVFFIVFAFISCNNSPKTVETEPKEDNISLLGAWEMMGYYNYKDNKITDSFNRDAGYRQVKMYTPTKVMWSKKVPSDSTEWFGYGSYKFNDTSLIEVLDYGSNMMNEVIKEEMEFKYELLLEKDKFTQIELDEEGNRIYSENYVRIE